jgi:hypothetical protein
MEHDGKTGDLFEARARTSDPATSHAAARSIEPILADMHSAVLAGVKACGVRGGTFYEVARKAQLEPGRVWKRLSELERRGLIFRTGETRAGETNRQCDVWLAHER